MALPTMTVSDGARKDRVIILLNGFDEKHGRARAAGKHVQDLTVVAREELLRSAARDREAVAFGFVGGRWVAAA